MVIFMEQVMYNGVNNLYRNIAEKSGILWYFKGIVPYIDIVFTP